MSTRNNWSYFNTPVAVYLSVTGPITALMAVLATLSGGWVRWSAVAIVVVSLFNLYRGYCRRLRIDDRGVSFGGWLSRVSIPWSQIRRIGCYKPLQGFLANQYIFVSRLDSDPPDPHLLNDDVIQVQNRPQLLDQLQAQHQRVQAGHDVCSIST